MFLYPLPKIQVMGIAPEKRRSKSKYNYETAGGSYIPTKAQHDFCFYNPELFITIEEEEAKNEVMMGYINNEKIKHDYIHVVNELMRNKNNL